MTLHGQWITAEASAHMRSHFLLPLLSRNASLDSGCLTSGHPQIPPVTPSHPCPAAAGALHLLTPCFPVHSADNSAGHASHPPLTHKPSVVAQRLQYPCDHPSLCVGPVAHGKGGTWLDCPVPTQGRAYLSCIWQGRETGSQWTRCV